MLRTLRLIDNKTETVFDDKGFEQLIGEYMGYEAAEYFRGLMNITEYEREKLRSTRSTITDSTLDLIYDINLANENDREDIAEEFRAIMEDVFGLEEDA